MSDSNYLNLFSDSSLKDSCEDNQKVIGDELEEKKGESEIASEPSTDKPFVEHCNTVNSDNTSLDSESLDNYKSAQEQAMESDSAVADENGTKQEGFSQSESEVVDLRSEFKTISDSLINSLNNLTNKVTMMESHISRLAAYDTAVETLRRSLAANQNNEKNLYKEVEAYKRGVYFTNIRPFLTFIIEMLCEMKASKKQYVDESCEFIEEHGESIYNEICGLLDFYISSFESQLKIQGVIITEYEPGEAYISMQQHVVKTISTDDRQKNGIVAAVLSDCYSYDKTVLKPARVNVYKYTAKS